MTGGWAKLPDVDVDYYERVLMTSVLKILLAVRKEENSFEVFAGIISVDPALSIKIQKIANLPLYGFPNLVDALVQKTALTGAKVLKI